MRHLLVDFYNISNNGILCVFGSNSDRIRVFLCVVKAPDPQNL